MRRDYWLTGVLFLAVALLMLGRFSFGWQMQRFFEISDPGDPDLRELVLENEVFRTELAGLRDIKNQIPSTSPHYLRASVYSRYPFNVKDEILVNVGEGSGVNVGQAVLFPVYTSSDELSAYNPAPKGILIGKVKKVFKDTALVQTVFDEGWRSATRIGDKGVDSLLAGGASPVVTLIPKEASLAVGDAVYNADPFFPYGLPIAQIEKFGPSPDHVFMEAHLKFYYDLNTIHTVLILKNYEPPQR